MNRLKQHVLQIIAFLLVLLLSVMLAGYFLMPDNNRYLTGYTAGGIWGEPEQSLDVLVMGDSNAAQAISPMQWYSDAGFTGYNYSVGWLTIFNIYYRLERLLEVQSPKVVLLCTGPCYSHPDDKTSTDLAFECTAEELLPLLRFHDNWKSWGSTVLTEGMDYTWRDSNKGFSPLSDVDGLPNTDYMADTGMQEPLSFWTSWYLRRTIRLCQEHDAIPVIITVPAALGWNLARHNGIQQVADEMNVVYYDMNLSDCSPGIDWRTDTTDGGTHLNLLGAQKVSAWLEERLLSLASLPDHRGDTAYAAWDEDAADYADLLSSMLPPLQETAQASLLLFSQSA